MADTKISGLTAASAIATTDLIPVVQTVGVGGVKATAAQFATFMSANSGWQFLGGATASTAVRTGTITWTGTFAELMFEYFISGYSGSAIGRLIVGPTAGLSETGTTFSTQQTTSTGATTTSGALVSLPGWPTAQGTAAAVARYGWMWVQNIAGSIKRMTGNGQYAGTAATTAPTLIDLAGNFNDTTNLINKAELASYTDNTTTTISAVTFNAGTYLNAWGRNTN